MEGLLLFSMSADRTSLLQRLEATTQGTNNLLVRGEFDDRRCVDDPAGKVLDLDLVPGFGQFIGLGESLLCGGNDNSDSTVAVLRIHLISYDAHRPSLMRIPSDLSDRRLVQMSHSFYLLNKTELSLLAGKGLWSAASAWWGASSVKGFRMN
ncbi:hypothetical protein [Bradyrhizobium tropiciagri]|uniref:hypothetical protein n=1 Tax=Bradyrhizobium tropiciagri TaxID=312253 RepID=UPI0012FE908B|nr:hypothetical protein [Bradyrhizobium tropiciagri]